MALHGLTLDRQIADAAAAAGLVPTPDQIERINTVAQSLAEQTDDGRASIDGLDPLAFIARELAVMPVARAAPPKPQTPGTAADPDEAAGVLRLGNTVQFGRHDAFARAVRAGQQAERAAAAEEAARRGNPWSKATWSRTDQAVLTNTDPQLAAQLRAAAGA